MELSTSTKKVNAFAEKHSQIEDLEARLQTAKDELEDLESVLLSDPLLLEHLKGNGIQTINDKILTKSPDDQKIIVSDFPVIAKSWELKDE